MSDIKARQEELRNEVKGWGSYFEQIHGHLKTAEAHFEEVELKLDKLDEDISKSNVEVPEGFVKHDGSTECPLPRGVAIKFLRRDGETCNCSCPTASRWSWCDDPRDIIAYKVTHVPTLKFEDLSNGDMFYRIHFDGDVCRVIFDRVLSTQAVLEANMGYATEELGKLALKHKCFNSEAYKRAFCGD